MRLPDIEVPLSPNSVRRPSIDLRDDGRELRDIVTDRRAATADRRPIDVGGAGFADAGSILGPNGQLADSLEAELWFG